MLAAMFAAWNRADLAGYVSFWCEDADLVNVLGCAGGGGGKFSLKLEFLHTTRFRGTQIEELGHDIRFLTPGIAIVPVRWNMRGDLGQPGHEVQSGLRQGNLYPANGEARGRLAAGRIAEHRHKTHSRLSPYRGGDHRGLKPFPAV